MPKYIDFDALGVQSCNPDVFVNKGYAEGWNSLMRMLYDAPAADVEPKQRWIPVTERLPEDGTYLITWKNHNAQGVCMAYYGYYQDGLHRSSKPDFYRYDNEWGDVTFDDVTHWMPIPEPPKGEDHEIL